MKKKLILILIILFIFSIFPFSAGATETTTTQTQEETSNKADNFREIVKSGPDPVWIIDKFEAPDKVATGGEFEVIITATNIGTGQGVAPEITFRENDGPLTSFSIMGSDSDVYTPEITAVGSGNSYVFKVKMKVNDTAREISGGYKMVAILRSYNAVFHEGNKNYTASNVFYLDVKYALSDPAFVVENVTFSPEVTENVTETTATFTVRNISDARANGVAVSLNGKTTSDGDKNIRVQDLSTSKLIGNIGGNQTFQVSYNIKLNTARKDNEMLFAINYVGAAAPKEETLNLPLPLNDSTTGKVPKVIINKYTVSPSKVYAGNQVKLTLYVENTNSRNVCNVQISLKVPENETATGSTVSGGTVFSPINSSNTFYLDVINGKSIAVKEINMFVDSNAAAKTYVVPVVIAYEDLDGNSYTVQDNVNIPVGQQSKFDIIMQNVSTFGQVGMPFDYNIEFVNTGKVAMSNFKVFLECDTINVADQVYYIGTFNVADTDNFSGTIFPEVAGPLNGAIVFTYDDNGEQVRVEYPFSAEIAEAPVYEEPIILPPTEPVEEPASLGDTVKKIAIVAGAIILIAGGGIVFYRKHKKKKEEEELLND